MSTPTPSAADTMAERFAEFIIHHANLALIMMGRVPHPNTGETVQDLDYARMLVDQLEMIEAKTAGNLSAQEGALLKQSLTTVRLAFVEAVGNPAPKPAATDATPSSPPPAVPPAPGGDDDAAPKRFSKKY